MKPKKFEIAKIDGSYRVLVLYPFCGWEQVAEVYDRKLASAIIKMMKGGDSFKAVYSTWGSK
jgi:hypothetical protein